MMGAITVKTFAEAHRIAMVRGDCKVQRLHGAWVVIPGGRPSRLARKLARRKQRGQL